MSAILIHDQRYYAISEQLLGSLVQFQDPNPVGSLSDSLTFAQNVTAGNLIVVLSCSNTAIATSVTDSQRNTYTKDKTSSNPSGNGAFAAIFHAMASTSGS
ncbi:MAG: hypothetical protein ACREBS_08675 [Nitrososphaerales archaeon]